MPTFGVNVAIILDGQILLTQRSDLPVWCLPGGAVDDGESLAQAAIREAREETGLDVELVRSVGVYSRPNWRRGGDHSILFTARPVGGELQSVTRSGGNSQIENRELGNKIVYDIRDLVKIYPAQTQPANDHITLQIRRGEIFGLLGENGAGKSTLVRQMVNLLRSTSGSIELLGQPIGRDPLHVPLNVGYMPQETHALNNLTVGEALYFTAHLRGLSRTEAQRERDALLDLWQIRELDRQSSQRLSGGQRRLLRLAVAMVGAPPVLILDEPTNDLDPQRRKLVWDVLRQVNHERGTTIIFITHDAIEAEKIIQRVGIMRQGRLVAVGRPSELKQRIDQKLRLELFFAPESPPGLPRDLTCHHLESGRWLVLLERERMMTVLNGLNLDRIDDFRLQSATLEDLYLHYAAH